LANRAIELAKAEVFQAQLPGFVQSARYVVQSSIPVGLNDEALKREETVHKMEICFDLLSSYFEQGAELARVNLVYELFTTPDLMRKAELLLTQPLGEMALSKAWTDLMAEDAAPLTDLTLLAYTALQVEARRPGTVPQELLASLSARLPWRIVAALESLGQAMAWAAATAVRMGSAIRRLPRKKQVALAAAASVLPLGFLAWAILGAIERGAATTAATTANALTQGSWRIAKDIPPGNATKGPGSAKEGYGCLHRRNWGEPHGSSSIRGRPQWWLWTVRFWWKRPVLWTSIYLQESTMLSSFAGMGGLSP
jgi:hypothetical protein